jgi:hypothetical protein
MKNTKSAASELSIRPKHGDRFVKITDSTIGNTSPNCRMSWRACLRFVDQ